MQTLSEKSKKEIFEKTLALIKNEEKRNWTKKVLGIFTEQFWTQPASTTGKYHPTCANVKSGLLIHTKRVVWFAIRFMQAFKYREENLGANNIEISDNIISACILHDGFKGGKGQSDYKTYTDHPILVEKYYKEAFPNEKLTLWQQEIFDLIKYHMAFWGPDTAVKSIKDYTTPELIVYMADYFASRKELQTKVDTFGMELEYEEDK